MSDNQSDNSQEWMPLPQRREGRMGDESLSIWQRRLHLQKERRKKMKEAMQEYDKQVYMPTIKALREECAASVGGHDWSFDSIDLLGDPWHRCNNCGNLRIDRSAND